MKKIVLCIICVLVMVSMVHAEYEFTLVTKGELGVPLSTRIWTRMVNHNGNVLGNYNITGRDPNLSDDFLYSPFTGTTTKFSTGLSFAVEQNSKGTLDRNRFHYNNGSTINFIYEVNMLGMNENLTFVGYKKKTSLACVYNGSYTYYNPPAGYTNMRFVDINNNGVIIGFANDSDGKLRSFIYQDGIYNFFMTDIVDLKSIQAYQINDNGLIAGHYVRNDSAIREGFVYNINTDDYELVSIEDGKGILITGIGNDGMICGQFGEDIFFGMPIVAPPEPPEDTLNIKQFVYINGNKKNKLIIQTEPTEDLNFLKDEIVPVTITVTIEDQEISLNGYVYPTATNEKVLKTEN